MVDLAKVAQGAGSIVDIVGRVATIGQDALPVLRLVADWSPVPIPFLAPVVSALEIGLPYVQKIAAAAPVVHKAIDAGLPIAQAIQQHGPDLLSALKNLYAIANNADPGAQAKLVPDQVSDQMALAFAHQSYAFAGKALFGGRRWTDEEYERWWNRATGEH